MTKMPTAAARFWMWASALLSPWSPGAAVAGAITLLTMVDSAAAQDLVRIRNSGSTAIIALRMSPDYQRSWGWNLLPVPNLAPGETVSLPFNRRAGCFFDILAVDSDGREIPRFSQNLCGGKVIQFR